MDDQKHEKGNKTQGGGPQGNGQPRWGEEGNIAQGGGSPRRGQPRGVWGGGGKRTTKLKEGNH
jgi:hypothetical protein